MICFGLLIMFCQPSAAPPPVDAYCEIAKPVYWDAADTRKTKEQVDRENRKFKRLCMAKKP